MTEIRFVVRGKAVSQGSKKSFAYKDKQTGKYRGAIVDNDKPNLTAWRNLVASEAQRAMTISDALEPPHMRALLGGALRLECHFTFERPKARKKEFYVITRPDIDKLIRAIMDALTGIIWHDDSQVAVVQALKTYSRFASCEIRINTLPNPEQDHISDGSNDLE